VTFLVFLACVSSTVWPRTSTVPLLSILSTLHYCFDICCFCYHISLPIAPHISARALYRHLVIALCNFGSRWAMLVAYHLPPVW
jgi:hypothetical protein